MKWVPVVVLFGFSLTLAVSMIRGGRFGQRWYTGGKSWLERDAEGRPLDRPGSTQWGGTTLDDR